MDHLVLVYSLDGQIVTEEIIPAEIQIVLSQFGNVFADPTTLPARHNYDRNIPLIHVAQPVNPRAHGHKSELNLG
jgi:hypothetical protein